jgi:hypothetical protein
MQHCCIYNILSTFATVLHLGVYYMKTIKLKTDDVGIISSTLCMIHCITTPFIFLAQSCTISCCGASPHWWRSIDFIFLLISLIAIYQSSKTTTKTWVKYVMWICWTLLLVILINESLQIFLLFKYAIYAPAISLVIIHIYNLKYCQCKIDTCCIN